MCLAAFALHQHPRFPLVLAANRDEYFARPAAPLAWWQAQPGQPPLLAGRDLQAGGTWLGLNPRGRLGLLTNVRAPARFQPEAPSRGSLVPDWLAHRADVDVFWSRVRARAHNGYNLIVADVARDAWFWLCSERDSPQVLGPGLYGLSNGLLDEPWPKVSRLKRALSQSLSNATRLDPLVAALFQALQDDTLADDALLPRTGVPLAAERWLSSVFIRSPEGHYGTRCSSLAITERTDSGHLCTHVFERSHPPAAAIDRDRHECLADWPAVAAG